MAGGRATRRGANGNGDGEDGDGDGERLGCPRGDNKARYIS